MSTRLKAAAKKRGRPPTGQGEVIYVPASIVLIVEALKKGKFQEAIALIKDKEQN